ncbi:putative Ig domain-containing protein [Streptomyces sp. NPDC089919]|uniref:putative Ig domain-containing protein n=1 Tax=Streptomyces sp. NPDC089919 TaxID=3155188 RepID=UPI00342AB7B9
MNLPAGLAVDRTTGVIGGTPTTWGFRTATVTVTDAGGKRASVSFTLNVYF